MRGKRFSRQFGRRLFRLIDTFRKLQRGDQVFQLISGKIDLLNSATLFIQLGDYHFVLGQQDRDIFFQRLIAIIDKRDPRSIKFMLAGKHASAPEYLDRHRRSAIECVALRFNRGLLKLLIHQIAIHATQPAQKAKWPIRRKAHGQD